VGAGFCTVFKRAMRLLETCNQRLSRLPTGFNNDVNPLGSRLQPLHAAKSHIPHGHLL
jgi:hypothetical protein